MEKGDFTNNISAMEKIAASDYKNDFLGGQNHIRFFLEAAKAIDKNCLSMYDLGMSEKLQTAMSDYFNNTVTEEKAWDNFYMSVMEMYPNLRK